MYLFNHGRRTRLLLVTQAKICQYNNIVVPSLMVD